MSLSPLELLDRLAALIPPPRRRRHHYHGVFAPHAALRARVTACAGQAMVPNPLAAKGAAHPSPPAPARRRASLYWARLLARIYECRPLTCPRCEGEMRLVAFLTEPAAIRAILAHLGEPTAPPPLAPRARAPPKIGPEDVGFGFAFDQSPTWDPIAPAPDSEVTFDQTLN